MKPSITDVFFDLDHTLWDFDRNSALAFKRVFENHEIKIDLEAFKQVYEPINFGYWKLYRENKVTKQELRRGRFREAFAEFDITFTVEELDHLATSYIDELPKDNHLLDGALEVLQYLRLKYRLHIITNGFQEVQTKKLHNSNIAHFFITVTTSEEVGVKKPHPDVFHQALSKADAHPDRSIMIGDTFEADIEGAANVGMDTIFYNYRQESVNGDFKVVHHLNELLSHL